MNVPVVVYADQLDELELANKLLEARVQELLEANTREVGRRREAENIAGMTPGDFRLELNGSLPIAGSDAVDSIARQSVSLDTYWAKWSKANETREVEAPAIMIAVQGGVVQNIVSAGPIEVFFVDWDNVDQEDDLGGTPEWGGAWEYMEIDDLIAHSKELVEKAREKIKSNQP